MSQGEVIDIAAKRRRLVLFTVVGVAFSAFWIVVIYGAGAWFPEGDVRHEQASLLWEAMARFGFLLVIFPVVWEAVARRKAARNGSDKHERQGENTHGCASIWLVVAATIFPLMILTEVMGMVLVIPVDDNWYEGAEAFTLSLMLLTLSGMFVGESLGSKTVTLEAGGEGEGRCLSCDLLIHGFLLALCIWSFLTPNFSIDGTLPILVLATGISGVSFVLVARRLVVAKSGGGAK
jgi:hypothetical protein